ncbi:GPR endopeptidase [Alicyclobacillus contaminans]|uniref:GPR endopeptidase n=1 Tax=Alicyclobacillus contaminans TaxID=392016 RepID=UPI000410FF96|nr:GPR endopeptidase [Alicyclobacillus contaminans]GMA52133.1 GPR endopeptidase [Alicyclobacillus contaminans]
MRNHWQARYPNRPTDDGWAGTGYSPRTDLALEAHALAKRRQPSVPGVTEEHEELEDITISRVKVTSEAGEQAIGKKRGSYITLDIPGLRHKNPALQDRVVDQLEVEFGRLFRLRKHAKILIVGLGNANVTPDALGPKVVERLFVTRHLFGFMPQLKQQGYRTVAAIAPGVLGVTGIETSEVVKGVVEHVKPDVVIAIDALASLSLSRVNSTIQIADTGISPGSGIGNKRQALDEETLGCQVYAIGVPTVVDAATIANDAMELVLDTLRRSVPNNTATPLFDQFNGREKWQMIREVLEPMGNNLMVTPKEVDDFVDDVADVIARGLNLALHPAMAEADPPVAH